MHDFTIRMIFALDKQVQIGALWCKEIVTLPIDSRYKRFTVSLDESDYKALRHLGDSQKPPLNLQYLVRLAVRNLLDQEAAKRPSRPLVRR